MVIPGDWCLFLHLKEVIWLEPKKVELVNDKRRFELKCMALTNLKYLHHLTDVSTPVSYFISAILRL